MADSGEWHLPHLGPSLSKTLKTLFFAPQSEHLTIAISGFNWVLHLPQTGRSFNLVFWTRFLAWHIEHVMIALS